MLAQAALLAIDGYQRHLSPRKGYACAYRIAHGGTGCSGFAKQALRDFGFFAAIPAIRGRFADCHAAALQLRLAREAEADPDETKPRRRWSDCDCGGCASCDFPIRGCGRGHDTTPDCDCTPDGCGS